MAIKALEQSELCKDMVSRAELHKLFSEYFDYLQSLDWTENPTAPAKQSGVNWCINTLNDLSLRKMKEGDK